ncbi:hypothetical protein OAU50_06890 [Planctomycetota bacterium]|nr:hypothetical protein [Planctomycetota bacterium]
MKIYTPIFLALLLLTGCSSGEIPRYKGPGGNGRLVYQDGRGIVREGSPENVSEAAMFERVKSAFGRQDWATCIRHSTLQTNAYPDGARAAESLLFRIEARLELGRAGKALGGLSVNLPISQWLFLYLAPDSSPELAALSGRDAEFGQFIAEFRDLHIDDFISDLAVDANAIYASEQLLQAQEDCRTMLVYYLPVQEIASLRARTANLTRDVAWLLYAARAYTDVIELTEDIRTLNPSPTVKGDTLFVEGLAQKRNGAAPVSARTFEQLFHGAGLRDTDTRWRPFALLQMIDQNIALSKGWKYDISPYERAIDLFGEYELYLIENPNVSPWLRDHFITLIERVYDVLILRAHEAARTHDHRGDEDAAIKFYAEKATYWEDEKFERVAALKAIP